MNALLSTLGQLIFPHFCAGCGGEGLSHRQLLCLTCLNQLPYTGFHNIPNNPVEKIFWGRLPVAAATSLTYFTKNSIIQHLLHQLKYKGNEEAGYFLGRQLGKSLCQTDRFGKIDALVPLPLHPSRKRIRGYNQAELISRGIAEITKIPVITSGIGRQASATQTHKNRLNRWLSIQGKFKITKPRLFADKHLLLVDDVITTGASLEAFGEAITAIAGTRISVATAAFAFK